MDVRDSANFPPEEHLPDVSKTMIAVPLDDLLFILRGILRLMDKPYDGYKEQVAAQKMFKQVCADAKVNSLARRQP